MASHLCSFLIWISEGPALHDQGFSLLEDQAASGFDYGLQEPGFLCHRKIEHCHNGNDVRLSDTEITFAN